MSSTASNTDFCVFKLVPQIKRPVSVRRYHKDRTKTSEIEFFSGQKAERNARAIAYVGNTDYDDVRLSESGYKTGCYFAITEAGDIILCDVSDEKHPTKLRTYTSGERSWGIILRKAGDTCVLAIDEKYSYTITFDSGEEFLLKWALEDMEWPSVEARRKALSEEYKSRDDASPKTQGQPPFRHLQHYQYEAVMPGTPRTPHIEAGRLMPFKRTHKYKEIGTGRAGTVYLAVYLRDGKEHAVKTINEKEAAKSRNKRQELVYILKKEVEALSKLQNPHITELLHHQFWYSGSVPEFWMPLYDGSATELVTELTKGHHHCGDMSTTPATEKLVKPFLLHCLCGLAYMHRRNLVHRDIKLDNILYRRSGSGDMKFCLADLSYMTTAEEAKGHVGDTVYVPPEHETGVERETGKATDIYMFGVALLEFLGMICSEEYLASTFSESSWGKKLKNSGTRLETDYKDNPLGKNKDLCIVQRLQAARTSGVFNNATLEEMLHDEPAKRPKIDDAIGALARHYNFSITEDYWGLSQ